MESPEEMSHVITQEENRYDTLNLYPWKYLIIYSNVFSFLTGHLVIR